METDESQSLKLGVKIERPSDIKIHPFFQWLAFFALFLICMTAWLLVLEYLGEPPPEWFRSFVDNVANSIL